MLVLAHISDLHLDGTGRATERAERVRDLLWGLPGRVDALLVTGDIADRDAPPGLAFHVLDDEGRLTSHFRVA